MKYTFTQLRDFITLNKLNLQREECGPYFEDVDDVVEHFLYYLSEMTPKFEKFINDHGLMVDKTNECVLFDPEQFPAIEEKCEAIVREYDDCGDPQDNCPTWKEFELSGDDDVDYNGGYIFMAMELLSYMAENM